MLEPAAVLHTSREVPVAAQALKEAAVTIRFVREVHLHLITGVLILLLVQEEVAIPVHRVVPTEDKNTVFGV